MTQEERSSPTRAERIALLGLLAATLLYQVVLFEPFQVPNNDWYSFEDAARHFAAGEWPLHSKRLPLLPALVGGLSHGFAGAHPELRAALVLNVLFSLGTLALLFRWASQTLGRGAILVPVLYASTVQFHAGGLQPLVEPSLAFCVVLAFTLHQAGSAWQYAAAAAAALGRYEAAALLPLFALTNALQGRGWVRQGAWAATGLVPLAAWRLAASLGGPGGGTYLDLMEGMGFAPAPGFAWVALGEAFPVLHAPAPLVWLGVVLVGVPLGFGVWLGLRERRAPALPLLAYFAAAVATVVVFGVPKARYVLPVLWIPIAFWVAGAIRGREQYRIRVAVDLGPSAPLVAGFGAVVAMLGAGLTVLATRRDIAPPGVEIAYALALSACAVPAVWSRVQARRAAGLVLLAAVVLLVTTGTARKQTALFNVYHANQGSAALAGWLEANLRPDEGVVVLNPGAVEFLTGLQRDRLISFAVTRTETLEELARFMGERGFAYAAWTHRRASDSRSAAYYDDRKNVDLARAFAEGGPVAGFEHVATLPAPEGVDQGDAHVYRLVRSSP